MAGRGELSPSRARELQAAKLRGQGLSFDEIADRLGFSDRSGARKAVDRALTRDVSEVEDLREVLLADTGMVRERLRPLVDRADPDLKAVDRFLKVIDLEARLGGVYKPETSVTVTHTAETVIVALQQHGQAIIAERFESSTSVTVTSTGMSIGQQIADTDVVSHNQPAGSSHSTGLVGAST